MSSPPRPSIRHCPVCGVSMQASKSREDLPDFDLFRCLSCGTLIRDAKPSAKTGKKGDKTSDQAGQAGSAEKP